MVSSRKVAIYRGLHQYLKSGIYFNKNIDNQILIG